MAKNKKKKLAENSFEAGVSGTSGTLNYQTGYGTPAGGNIVQDPRHFASSDKTTDHFKPNTSRGSATLPPIPEPPDRIGGNITTAGGTGDIDALAGDQTTSPAANADQQAANKPLDPDQQFDPQVDQLFQKKETPSPDEIMSALQYELSQMVKKDKTIAKQTVLSNLRIDPHYYSNLDMLNIDDDKMKIDELSTFSKTKNLLDDMINERRKRFSLSNLNEIFDNLSKKRRGII